MQHQAFVLEKGVINRWTPLMIVCGIDYGDEADIPAISFCRTHGAAASMNDIQALLKRKGDDVVPDLDALFDPRSPCDGPVTVIPFSLRDQYEDQGFPAGEPWGTKNLGQTQSQSRSSPRPLVNAVTMSHGSAVKQKLLAIGADITIEGRLALCRVLADLENAGGTDLSGDPESVAEAKNLIAIAGLLVEAGVDLTVPVEIDGFDAPTGEQALHRAFTANEVER
ncbi:hypothetical protein HDU87_004117 [Geranomyces variabilis]|uniref:Uncharacterized protein n=1 Tax=Geranomyces variabilis TaxID=109894 RepID=A0AAD5TT99_9FUNG|nr:hypothetical protein HDU87_004117 [Geranomyces variabilis]